MVHTIRTQGIAMDLTCIAWNHFASSPFMFATGSSDGTVRIWTTGTAAPTVIVVESPSAMNKELEEGDENGVDEDEDLVGEAMLASPLDDAFPTPEAFTRQVDMTRSFAPFTTFKVQDNMDDLIRNIPRMPLELISHDVQHDDWIRLMQV